MAAVRKVNKNRRGSRLSVNKTLRGGSQIIKEQWIQLETKSKEKKQMRQKNKISKINSIIIQNRK